MMSGRDAIQERLLKAESELAAGAAASEAELTGVVMGELLAIDGNGSVPLVS
jgi:hypothetical protein